MQMNTTGNTGRIREILWSKLEVCRFYKTRIVAISAIKLSTTSHQIPICEDLNLCASTITGTSHILSYTYLQLQVISKADASKMFEVDHHPCPQRPQQGGRGQRVPTSRMPSPIAKLLQLSFQLKRPPLTMCRKRSCWFQRSFWEAIHSTSTSSISAHQINYIMCNKCA